MTEIQLNNQVLLITQFTKKLQINNISYCKRILNRDERPETSDERQETRDEEEKRRNCLFNHFFELIMLNMYCQNPKEIEPGSILVQRTGSR